MHKRSKQGFTLIEMLAVIAIIAILVAVIIPVATYATERAKEAKDVASIRAAIAEITINALNSREGTVPSPRTVVLSQTGAFDQNVDLTEIAGFPISAFEKEQVVISWDVDNGWILVDGVSANSSIFLDNND